VEDVALAALVVVAGLLVGNECGTRFVVHPALGKLEHREQVLAERSIYAGEARWVPFLMVGSMVLSFVAAGAADGDQATLLFAAGACIVAVVAITLVFNMPLNLRVLRATPEIPEDEWRSIRRRWDRLHSIRIVLDIAALGLIAAAAVS
jgi:uncharacterized membrane protein